MNLNTNKAAGPDGITAALLKKCIDVFAPILSKFFQRSYCSGIVPKTLKCANVVPIFESGEKKRILAITAL